MVGLGIQKLGVHEPIALESPAYNDDINAIDGWWNYSLRQENRCPGANHFVPARLRGCRGCRDTSVLF